MSSMIAIGRSVVLAAALFGVNALGATDMTAVPPATYSAPAIEKAATATRPLVGAQHRTIELAAPSTAELKAGAKANATGKRAETKARARVIGIGRELDMIDRTVRPSDLSWVAVGDGGRAARIDVRSVGAAAIRVALVLPHADPDLTIRFAGAANSAQIFGPYAANAIVESTARDGAYWTPVLEGDTAILELYAPAAVAVNDIALSIARVSHLSIAPADLRNPQAKLVSDIGTSGSCEVDTACVSNAAVTQTAKSVAQLLFTEQDGRTAQCTGTLINAQSTTQTPYLYTASHCIDSQFAANTLNTYWFFDAVSCSSLAPPPIVLRTGGAMLLGRSEDYDWSIVRLRDAPPDGTTLSAWRAEMVAAGTSASTIHHPQGDLKKYSQGTTTGYYQYPDLSTFIEMQWTSGSTEPGSSGAGLFTFQTTGGFFELRGGLFGGSAFCGNPTGRDRFSRLDKALPLMRQYLTPSVSNPNGEVVVVEFYNRSLDHYFITSNPVEINDLDTGVHPGWERTGLRWLAYGDPALAPAGATPVCRFYLNPAVGDSHFYSGDPAECAATQTRFGASWTFESASVFWTVLPDRTTGACPAGMNPIYRFFNTQRTNHRYTMEVDIQFDLANSPGWIAEGYGPDSVIMCSPAL